MDTRKLSNRILEYAASAIPRAQFLKEISRLLLEHVSCDVVRIDLRDRGQRYRSVLTSRKEQPFRYEVTPSPQTDGSDDVWTSGESDILEQLCSDIINMRTDPSKPWFTSFGSLWTNDVEKLSISGRETDTGMGIQVGATCSSVALIPIEGSKDLIGLLQIESQTENGFDMTGIVSCERLAQTLGVALAHRHLQVALRERVKELTCLYGIASLAAQPDISLEELLQSTVELLPPAWLFPDACCARIVLQDKTYASSSYKKPYQTMKASLVVVGGEQGFVEVGYVWEKPHLDEGPFLNEERHLINAIASEISMILERRQAEVEKSKLHSQLLHADRLATIGQLGAGLAHELNEPLSSILGFAQLACKDQELSAQTTKDIEKIVSASLHAREVIAKLLTFARETTPAKSEVDLNELVEDGLHFLEARCNKAGIEIVRKLASSLPRITADRSQLLQVLTNLVVNAIQAMPKGGVITIATDHQEDQVLMSVEDTGVGMTEDVMKTAFDPFFTTKDIDQGTGLGLSVVHGIVTAHCGTVQVASVVNQGTKFEVRLPARTLDQDAGGKGDG